jgi:hypothetical protein
MTSRFCDSRSVEAALTHCAPELTFAFVRLRPCANNIQPRGDHAIARERERERERDRERERNIDS